MPLKNRGIFLTQRSNTIVMQMPKGNRAWCSPRFRTVYYGLFLNKKHLQSVANYRLKDQ